MTLSSPPLNRFRAVALGLCCILPGAAPILGQEASSPNEPETEAEEPGDGDTTFLDEVTVTAGHVPASLRDTPGHVSIVTDEYIADHLYEDIADLVKYEPGVYVEGDSTRLGLNGFNIRGIGGNRVLTQVDGVPNAEQFDFGPFNVHQQAIDIDTLKSAEIVRSAGSALYGSDAVGGVISLITKNPSDYLGNRNRHFGLKAGFDGRSQDSNLNLSLAGGGETGRASLFFSSSNGSELDNAGEAGGRGTDRDLPNPQERERLQALGKAAYDISTGNTLRATFELNTADVETDVVSALGTSRLGPFTITNFNVLANEHAGPQPRFPGAGGHEQRSHRSVELEDQHPERRHRAERCRTPPVRHLRPARSRRTAAATCGSNRGPSAPRSTGWRSQKTAVPSAVRSIRRQHPDGRVRHAPRPDRARSLRQDRAHPARLPEQVLPADRYGRDRRLRPAELR